MPSASMLSPGVLAAYVVVALVLTATLTGLARRYALARRMLDHPNERSSHTVPTPRGGGLAIVVVVLGSIAALFWQGTLAVEPAAALLGGGLMVALVGWLDDHRSVAPGPRFVVHLLAAVWAVAWLGGYPTVDLGEGVIRVGWVGAALAVVAIVWVTNLYNFMDGTDGIAGVQAVFAGCLGALLLAQGGAIGLAAVAVILAAAGAGFLLWNWPPARIFMGDAGSYLLGFAFAVLAFAGERAGALPAVIWSILLGWFVWDATLTLTRRVLAGERWYSPHRSHAYQRLTQLGLSHRQLLLVFIAVSLLLLAPLAWLARIRHDWTVPAVALAAVAVAALWAVVQISFRLRTAGKDTP